MNFRGSTLASRRRRVDHIGASVSRGGGDGADQRDDLQAGRGNAARCGEKTASRERHREDAEQQDRAESGGSPFAHDVHLENVPCLFGLDGRSVDDPAGWRPLAAARARAGRSAGCPGWKSGAGRRSTGRVGVRHGTGSRRIADPASSRLVRPLNSAIPVPSIGSEVGGEAVSPNRTSFSIRSRCCPASRPTRAEISSTIMRCGDAETARMKSIRYRNEPMMGS